MIVQEGHTSRSPMSYVFERLTGNFAARVNQHSNSFIARIKQILAPNVTEEYLRANASEPSHRRSSIIGGDEIDEIMPRVAIGLIAVGFDTLSNGTVHNPFLTFLLAQVAYNVASAWKNSTEPANAAIEAMIKN